MSAYLNTAEASAYFAGRLNATAWDNATHNERVKALTTATRLIDTLDFIGTPDSDEHAWPRNGEPIPERILHACCEIALELLNGYDLELEARNLHATSLGVGTLKTVQGPTVPQHMRAGIPSVVAWNYMLAYLKRPYAID